MQNHVYDLHDEQGRWHDDSDEVTTTFVDYYKNLLGINEYHRHNVIAEVIQAGPTITYDHRAILEAPYT